ncbi:hypothetical protein [uncultured Hyphomonas sp.]|uniref:hypothetical protein n=1 Tax=uncultured Hyphomonas sp. TaxID=225298 RepID=UPI002AAC2F98|nr:hypothetical protein [uncultured Hyphomonas sp.]
MHPDLRRLFQLVWPVFWPWLVWNLVRVARWHLRTGREALFAVDCFGNVRLTYVADAPPPDDLYTYEAPRVAAWDHPALGSDMPVSVFAGVRVQSAIVHHDPVKSGMVMHRHGIVRYDHGLHVRGPP